jgi:predicted DNA-binding transcriptional regulator AlpA
MLIECRKPARFQVARLQACSITTPQQSRGDRNMRSKAKKGDFAEHAETSGVKGFDALDDLLTPRQAAAYLRLSVATLQRHRTNGTGPKFLKLGRKVAYRAVDLQLWIETRVAASTADARVRGLAA